MTRKQLRRTLTAADHDAQGNVTVWDHGPEDKPHDHPVAMQMTPGDAGQALQADKRYALEPDVDDAEVAKAMAHIKAGREGAAKVAAERAEAAQLAADRKAAVAIVAARRRAEEKAAPVEEAAPAEDAPAPAPVDPPPAPLWTPPPAPPVAVDAPSSENHSS